MDEGLFRSTSTSTRRYGTRSKRCCGVSLLLPRLPFPHAWSIDFHPAPFVLLQTTGRACVLRTASNRARKAPFSPFWQCERRCHSAVLPKVLPFIHSVLAVPTRRTLCVVALSFLDLIARL